MKGTAENKSRLMFWPQLKQADVLLVEDDPDLARLIEALLKRKVSSILTAGSLSEAKQMLLGFAPDLIILDRALPDGDGVELCEQLKSNERTWQIPILFVSALRSPEDCVTALRAGGDDYLKKPFGPQELLVRAQALLRSYER